ncbi:MAG TPA: hypothetical protein VF132_06880 [Rudaea sp.]
MDSVAIDALKPPRTTRARWLACTAGLCLAFAANADVDLTSSVITAGSTTAKSPGGCFRLVSTIGQGAGSGAAASGGIYTLQAGFLAGRGDTDTIFHHGFEVCS